MPAATTARKKLLAGASASMLGLPRREQSAGMRVLAAIKKPARNVYQRSFIKFWDDLVWTKDESRAGEVRKAPAWPMFRDMEEDLLTEKLLLFDKSRRVMASWFVCAFDIWLMAGGQDPRWPSLMRAVRNRQCVLASRKEKGFQGSAWFIESRVQFIAEELERRNIREAWPEWPTWKWTYCAGENSLGSRIDGVPQGADQCRGPGATFLHFEEVAAWEQAQASVESAKMTLLSDEGYGGHLCCLTTAKVGTYAADIVTDQIGTRGWD
jgi:hypothetical protein